ncbi:MEMO1 family protein [Geosmithia morbida]|uniref:MEMO1 family protein n=1 Tax=Geosmithia morbida TaxID=1094350 RepID=A0A9P4YY33_9HYPO|nr:MEMO1 family protein [Geosmithia morbida]KAF4125211.1 MEMO1 family protein [Geosmithia morbida]
MGTRPPAKAGSWYVSDAETLNEELDEYLSRVPDSINGSPSPIAGARMVIAPHAGFTYSGPCAAWAYKLLDVSRAKRVFLLGPSHTYYLSGCAVTTFDRYQTPFGALEVDRETVDRVKQAGGFGDIPPRKDTAEHSLEMHTPYIYKRLEQEFGSDDPAANFPKLVPILIGDNDGAEEKEVAKVLAPYLADPESVFVVSSDFCHWGGNFSYTVHAPDGDWRGNLQRLRSRDRNAPAGIPIHETIRLVDQAAMDAVESGSHDAFVSNLALTGNTVCGRHPIGVAMAALELLGGKSRFKVVQYQRSNLVQSPSDFSVSYVSAYAVV